MRISVDIDDEILKEVMSLTGEKSKSPALAKAVTEYVRRQKAKVFGRLIREGKFDYPDSQEEAPTEETNPPPLW
ncbi:MAG: type II toxin-antitoxin system VapB family antitoxin [Verrucomicrobia bacterium]|nr:type II toxin-antitoxin system VapB family antitoxin [Verrucomicrobiota bacterium]